MNAGREYVIFGIDNYKKVIDEIEADLSLEEKFFDIRLILTEAITNAYYHGNNGDRSKPIHIAYSCVNNSLHIEVRDCGDGSAKIKIPEEIPLENLLEERGRGLYLIKCCCDKVVFLHNCLIVDKNISI